MKIKYYVLLLISIMFAAGISSNVAKATPTLSNDKGVYSVGIYDSVLNSKKSILVVCFNKAETDCERLTFFKEDLDSKAIENWFNTVLVKRGL